MLKINSKNYESKDTLKVDINGKVYTMPLVKFLPYKKIRKLSALSEEKNFDVAIELMSEYIPKEVLEDLTVEQLTSIFKAWNGVEDDEAESDGIEDMGK